MEIDFRARSAAHHGRLPTRNARFEAFSTSPFVLLIYAMQQGYRRVEQVEEAILPAKVFSSMETSSGRMAEAVALLRHGWEIATSAMHSPYSAIDGLKRGDDQLRLMTLKSGPRCLNDEMSENFADAILGNYATWAREARVERIDFTYGVLYGTRRKSNKKDWHILRNIEQKLGGDIEVSPDGRWDCRFVRNGIDVRVTIRIGVELWTYIADSDLGFMELCVALLRSCVQPTDRDVGPSSYRIADLGEIISLQDVPTSFNAKILQRSQLEWLFLFARHFCDELESGDWSSLPES